MSTNRVSEVKQRRENTMHGSRAQGSSSPLATVDDIQRRLLRPPSLQSPLPISSPYSLSLLDFSISLNSIFGCLIQLFGVPSSKPSQFKQEEEEMRETVKKKKKKKLEDFLDPVLLSAISSKIGRVKKVPEMKPKKVIKDFEWPVDELKAFVADSRSDQVVDLNNDFDFIQDRGNGAHEDQSCTPFRRFEQTALRRFKELDQP